MIPEALDRDSTLAILVGASDWPKISRFEAAPAFSNTAKESTNYLSSPEGLNLKDDNLLNLFDSGQSSTGHYGEIRDFLERHIERLNTVNGKNLVVFFWYIGHGALLGPEADYCLLLRDTDANFAADSSMRVTAIADLFRKLIPQSARFVILDCCHAGHSNTYFQGAFEDEFAVQTERAFKHGSGVAILAASSAKSPAQLQAFDTWTLFGRSLLDVLKCGNPTLGPAMSLHEVKELVTDSLRSGSVEHPPIPEVHSPNQKDLDLAGVRVFPNVLYDSTGNLADLSLRPTAVDSSHITTNVLGGLTTVDLMDGKTDENLQQLVLNGSAISAVAAARLISDERKPISSIVKSVVNGSDIEAWRICVVREALRADPESVADAVLPLVQNLGVKWRLANSAVELLSPVHHDYVIEDLANILRESNDYDLHQIAIEGLGRVGAGRYASLVVNTADEPDGLFNRDSYKWGKLSSFVPVALARMTLFEQQSSYAGMISQPGCLLTFANFVERNSDNKQLNTAFERAESQIRKLGSGRADDVIQYLLNSENTRLVRVGACTLGSMGLVRGRRPLIERMQKWGTFTDEVGSAMALELGRIGGTMACDWLMKNLEGNVLYSALALCLKDLPDNEFKKTVSMLIGASSSQLAWWSIKSLGRRPLRALEPDLYSLLESDNWSIRGVSGIALASTVGSSAKDRLNKAAQEAGREDERALLKLALLISTQDVSIVGELESPLVGICSLMEPSLIDDVCHYLDLNGGKPGAELAQTLRWIAVESD